MWNGRKSANIFVDVDRESSQERRRGGPCPATSRSAPTWGDFVKYGVRRQYRSGEVLLEKGAPSTQAGFLVKGQLRTFCLGPSGDEISLFYLGPGNLFGSSALVYHAKVMVSVSAISPAEVYLLAADRFWKLWQEHGYPPQDLMAHFVRRITMLSDYICCSHFLEDDKRVAYFLHTCCASSGPAIPYTHEQIAAITGMSRVSVTRILKQFREAGILRQAYRRIEILDPQRLSEVFDSLGYFLD